MKKLKTFIRDMRNTWVFLRALRDPYGHQMRQERLRQRAMRAKSFRDGNEHQGPLLCDVR